MEMYIITSSENMELVKFMTAAAGTILHFGIALIIWRTIWCTVRQLNTPTMKVVGLGGCWVVWILELAVWLALNEDPLFTENSILLGILVGIAVAAIICMMIAAHILLRAYMHKEDKHRKEAFI